MLISDKGSPPLPSSEHTHVQSSLPPPSSFTSLPSSGFGLSSSSSKGDDAGRGKEEKGRRRTIEVEAEARRNVGVKALLLHSFSTRRHHMWDQVIRRRKAETVASNVPK